MRYGLWIDQCASLEWGLNLKQAHVFAVIYEAATWADRDDAGEFWNLAKSKIIKEIPLVVSKEDTVYRITADLKRLGLIDKKVVESKEFYRITPVGLRWNSDQFRTSGGEGATSDVDLGVNKDARKNIRGSEKNPNDSEIYPSEGVFLPADRKNIRESSEKNPSEVGKKSDVLDYQDTITNINSSFSSGAGEAMTDNWWPPNEIEPYCRQIIACSDSEFVLVVVDYRMFWQSDDAVRRPKPRSWGNHFKKSYSGILNRIRSDRSRAENSGSGSQRSRDIPIRDQLRDTSWAN